MADLDSLKNDAEFWNYVNIQVALCVVGEALATYAEDKVRAVHAAVHATLTSHNLPTCHNHCSEQLRRQFNHWCRTCASWKKELESPSNMRPPAGAQAQWDKMTSWEWPANPANIVQVFIQPGFSTTRINLQDLSTSLSILRRCARVPDNTMTVADTLREFRNAIVHAGTLKVDDSTKNDIFENIRNLLSDNDVKPSIANFLSVMEKIKNLANEYEDDEEEPDLNPDAPFQLMTRADWLARPPKEVELVTLPQGVVFIHHSCCGEAPTKARCCREVRYIQSLHMDGKGWADIAYNFVVGEDGRVYEGRSWDKVGAHTLGWNKVAISICFMGDYSTKLPPQKSLNAAQELLKYGVANGKLTPDYRLYGHRDARGTDGSPGQMLYDVIRTWGHFDHDAMRPLPRP